MHYCFLGSDKSIPTTTLIYGGLAAPFPIMMIIVIILALRSRDPSLSEKNHNKEIGMDNLGKEASDYPTIKEKSIVVT